MRNLETDDVQQIKDYDTTRIVQINYLHCKPLLPVGFTMSIRFDVEHIDGSRLGKLDVPNSRISDWINFLVAPSQRAQIVATKQSKAGLTLYFQADEGLYAYLDGRFNCKILPQPQNMINDSI